MRTAEEMELQEAGRRLVETFQGRTFGTIEVLGGDVEVRPNSEGDQATFVTLILSEPTEADGPPWPRADLRHLRDEFREHAAEANPFGLTYLWMRSSATGSLPDPEG